MSPKQSLQPTDRLCFLHIVKTAGASFSHHLKNQFNAADICPSRYWPDLLAMPESDRNRYRLVSGHFSADISKYLDHEPTKYLTMLRDPIERTISVYEYLKQYMTAVRSDHDYGRMATYMNKFRRLMDGGMESFIRTADKDVRLAVSNTQTLIVAAGDPEALPEYVADDLLDKAKANLRKFAFFGLAERMQDSLDLLSYTFGWRPFRSLEVNVTPNKSRITGLSASLVTYITDTNRLDAELYRFASELFAERYAQMVEELNKSFPAESGSSRVTGSPASLSGQLQRHFEQCYRENPAIVWPGSFTKTLGSFPVGEGWWEWEAHGDSGHRWTGPGTVSTLDLPLSTHRPLNVTVKIVSSAMPDILYSLRLEVNGRAVECQLGTDPSGFTVMRALLSSDVLKSDKPFVRMDLIVNRTVSLREIDPTLLSDRNAGVAIHAIEVQPADLA